MTHGAADRLTSVLRPEGGQYRPCRHAIVPICNCANQESLRHWDHLASIQLTTTQQVASTGGETRATCLVAEGHRLEESAADFHQGLLEINYACI